MPLEHSEHISLPLEAAYQWLRNYLGEPHDLLGRKGPVCPFVAPAMNAGTLRVQEWPVDPEINVDNLVDVIHHMAENLDSVQWVSRNPALQVLVLVLTGLADEKLELLDDAHRRTKSELVQRGFILGQFHPRCQEKAAHNPDFLVSRSPVPMFGMRRMAFHDVLFLDSDPEWFAAYRKRYGARYESKSVSDPLLMEIFARAQSRWK